LLQELDALQAASEAVSVSNTRNSLDILVKHLGFTRIAPRRGTAMA